MSEKVDHPSYYRREDKKECIEEIKEKYGDFITCIFCLTNAYKYLYRAGAKEGNSAEQDIAKAIWYWKYFSKFTNAYAKEAVQTQMFKENMKLVTDVFAMFAERGVNPNND